MRVVGGVAKGKRLKGATIAEARPTSELVRGAIFNILGPLDLKPIRVLDLYAGSGSLGIEALSRGAGWADFVERHPRQCAAIHTNLEATGFTGAGHVYCMESEKAMAILEGQYDLVLMDPPYKLENLDTILDKLVAKITFNKGARLVVGHSKRLVLKTDYPGMAFVRQYRYGDSTVELFNKGED